MDVMATKTDTVTPSIRLPVAGALAPTSGPVCPHCNVSRPGRTPRSNDPSECFTDISFQDMAQVIFDTIGDAVLAVDPSGRVIYLNKAAQELTGWETDRALGRPLEQVFFLLDPVTRERSTSPAHQAIRAGQLVALTPENLLIRRDGTTMAIENSAAPVPNRLGGMAGAVIVFREAAAQQPAFQQAGKTG